MTPNQKHINQFIVNALFINALPSSYLRKIVNQLMMYSSFNCKSFILN